MKKHLDLRANIALGLLFAFLVNSVGPCPVYGQSEGLVLPSPGQMVALSPEYSPAVLKGIQLDPKNPFKFHFFVDTGDSKLSVETPLMASQDRDAINRVSTKLIKYFLASLTIPEKDLWVNLSPYEKDRIVPLEFGQTEMGRDLLAQDYLLKQITASLIYPESQLGKEFWNKVYAQAEAKYGTTNIPINTFNKVWIVPDKAVVYENDGTAFVLENHLKVMLEQDYLSLQKHQAGFQANEDLNVKAPQGIPFSANELGSQIIREIVIPALTKEVNEGKNFAQLRQVFYSLILATWYKKKIKDSILNKIYSNQNKINGVNVSAQDKDKIYQEYLKAFKKGVFNYIQDADTPNGVSVPRKYFSGGVGAYQVEQAIEFHNLAMLTPKDMATLSRSLTEVSGDMAMVDQAPSIKPNADEAMKVWVPIHAKEFPSFKSALARYSNLVSNPFYNPQLWDDPNVALRYPEFNSRFQEFQQKDNEQLADAFKNLLKKLPGFLDRQEYFPGIISTNSNKGQALLEVLVNNIAENMPSYMKSLERLYSYDPPGALTQDDVRDYLALLKTVTVRWKEGNEPVEIHLPKIVSDQNLATNKTSDTSNHQVLSNNAHPSPKKSKVVVKELPKKPIKRKLVAKSLPVNPAFVIRPLQILKKSVVEDKIRDRLLSKPGK